MNQAEPTWPSVSRRSLFAAGAIGTLAFSLPTRADATGSDFETILENWRNHLIGTGVDPTISVVGASITRSDAIVDDYLALIAHATDRVFTDCPLPTTGGIPESAFPTITLQRLEAIATAFLTPGSSHFEDSAILTQVLSGMELVNARVYKAGQDAFGNWWNWEIGAAQALMNLCVLLRTHIPAANMSSYLSAIDHFIPDSRFTARRAANRMDLCQSMALRGALGDSTTRLDLARNSLATLFVRVTTGDGFYLDGSYIDHDDIAYTGTYGCVFLSGFVDHCAMLAGTSYALSATEVTFVSTLVDKTYIPIVVDGMTLDNVRGRAISRRLATSRDDGHTLLSQIALLARLVPPSTQIRWRQRVKGWLERIPGTDKPLADPAAAAQRTVNEVIALHEIVTDPNLLSWSEPVRSDVLGAMARLIHRRSGWTAAVSMSTSRVAHFEANTENLRGWHTGAGMVTILDQDRTHYLDDYWPTVDPYHLPGTTVDQRQLANGQGGGWRARDLPTTSWAGGATLGTRVAGGMELDGLGSSVHAFKSWFCVDDVVVAIGSGITASPSTSKAPCTADTYVNAGIHANTNFGTAVVIGAKATTPDYTRHALLKYDVPTAAGLPGAQSVLNLFAHVNDGAGTRAVIAIYKVTGAWTENAVTWTSRPTLGAKITTIEIDNIAQWRQIDLSTFASSRAGQSISLALVEEQPAGWPGVWVAVQSRNHATRGSYLNVTVPSTTEVHTTLENRLVHNGSAPAVIISDQAQPTGNFTQLRSGQHWTHVAGVGGFIWLSSQGSVTVKRANRTGSWSDIDANAMQPQTTRSYVSIVANHGTSPVSSSYWYVMLPGSSVAQTRALATTPPFSVLDASELRHVINHPSLGLLAGNFWQAGSSGWVTVDRPCSIVARDTGSQIEVSVATPNGTGDTVHIELNRTGFSSVSLDGGSPQPIASASHAAVTVQTKEHGQSTVATFVQ